MVTVEALAFLGMGWLAGRILSAGFIGSFFAVHQEFMLKWALSLTGYFVDTIAILSFLGAVIFAIHHRSLRFRYRYYLTVGILIVAVSATFSIIGRLGYGTTYGAHDGVVQSEIAADLLLKGHNPYAADFTGTPFEVFHRQLLGQNPSPILHYYPYPPLIPLLTVPLVWIGEHLNIPADGRLVTMLFYALFCFAVFRLAPNDRVRLWLVLALLCNPFAFALWIAGLNDSVFVFFLTMTAMMGSRRRWIWSAAMLGLAITAKQTAIIAAPLWLWWLWLEHRSSNISLSRVWRSVVMVAVTTIALYGPFLVWNASALFDDLVRFVGGSIPMTYVIGGDSLWQLLVILRLVDSAYSPTIHAPVVAAVAVGGLVLGFFWLRQRRSASQWLMAVALVTLLMSVVNRFFFENYAAAIFLLFVAALVIRERENNTDIVEPA